MKRLAFSAILAASLTAPLGGSHLQPQYQGSRAELQVSEPYVLVWGSYKTEPETPVYLGKLSDALRFGPHTAKKFLDAHPVGPGFGHGLRVEWFKDQNLESKMTNGQRNKYERGLDAANDAIFSQEEGYRDMKAFEEYKKKYQK